MNVYGVDFSGAVDAGRKIWIAGGEVEGGALHLTTCLQAADLQGGALAREEALTALGHFIALQTDAAFGLDFPFSLAQSDIPYATWLKFVHRFPADYPAPTAVLGKNARRQTDREAKTPFAPGNLRLYRQTYYGIRDLLAPLLIADAARVVPMQVPAPGKPIVAEICPASTLKRLGLYTPYKGKTEVHQGQRQHILRALEGYGLSVEAGLEPHLIEDTEGDAIDSAIAAFTTANCAARGVFHQPDEPPYILEGRVYVGEWN
jgi:hypothetical protein